MHVVVLGGATNQLACIQAAKRLGAKVTVVDPRSSVPGIAVADAWIPIDVLDTDNLRRSLSKVDAVLTDQSDYTARAAAQLAQRLGLPGQDLELIEACTNKLKMRKIIAKAAPDLVPAVQHAQTREEAHEFLEGTNTRKIIKPLQAQGSRGVSLLTPEDFDSAIERAFEVSGGHGILIEEVIQGREYSIDGFVRDGQFTPLGIADKDQYTGNPCLDERIAFLPSHFSTIEDSLFRAMRQIVTVLNIKVGIVHAELFANPEGVKLVEIALRGGGSGISSTIIPFLSQFDPVEELLRELLGLPGQPPARDFHQASAILRFLPPGPIPNQLPAADPSIHGWKSLDISASASPLIEIPRSSEDRMGSIIVMGESEAAVQEAEHKAFRRLGYAVGVE